MVIRAWFALSSFVLVGVLVAAAVMDYRTEWRAYQLEYKERALAKERIFSVREIIQNEDIKIHQNYLPGLGRIDRCASCHLGVENPKMVDEPQPFTTHPGKLLETHEPQTFGCTLCHGGQGLATMTQEAHGAVAHWDQPLRQPLEIEAACGICHREGDLPGAQRLNTGRALFRELGCVGCHRVANRGQEIGPDLSRVAASRDFLGDGRVVRKDWQWHVEHLLAPRSRVPTSFMPDFKLSRDQATALTVFVYSLSGREIPIALLPAWRPDIRTSTPVEAGRRVFVEYGCAGCHGVAGQGGHANPNSQSGGQVPALAKVKQGYTREALTKRIKEGVRPEKADPNGPDPPLYMPAWGSRIDDQKLALVVDYLFSLAPKDEEEDDDDWDE